jgi:hypothetical protein
MEARSVDAIPQGTSGSTSQNGMAFAACFPAKATRSISAPRRAKDLGRYFPELQEAARDLKATAFALDGEIVVPHGETLSFDDLVAADSSRREPGEKTIAGDAGAVLSPSICWRSPIKNYRQSR